MDAMNAKSKMEKLSLVKENGVSQKDQHFADNLNNSKNHYMDVKLGMMVANPVRWTNQLGHQQTSVQLKFLIALKRRNRSLLVRKLNQVHSLLILLKVRKEKHKTS